jgi:uncharacterized protein YecE (DUF72 family)
MLGDCRVRVGSTSWADPSLVRDGGFYPRRSMTARERLAFYAQRLPVVELTTTYRFPPTPPLCAQWAERTPSGFVFDVRAWSLLSGCPTLPDSLWPDLQAAVPPARRDSRRLYAHHLPSDVLDECWARFAHALRPLADAGRLGVVVLRYPSWFSPSAANRAELATLPRRLPGLHLAVELRSPRWFADGGAEETLELLEAHGLGFVCVDGPTGPAGSPVGTRPPAPATSPVVAATSDVALVRFPGRPTGSDPPWTRSYRYSHDELAEWVGPVEELAASSRELHLLLDNGGAAAVANALSLLEMVRAAR